MWKKCFAIGGLAAVLCLPRGAALAQFPQPDGGTIERGVLPQRWLSEGPKCMEIPQWQVHEYNPNFFILRQSPCTDYEKPFIFLLFGKDKAMLVDTGSRNGNLVPSLQWTVKNWLARNGRTSIPLIVVHTHEHEDHTWGDAAVKAMNDPAMPVTFVPAQVEATKRFYGIEHWPTDVGHVDLGGRVIDVIPIPGHSIASVAFYDRNTAILLSGDSLYPGRLYVQDFPAFQSSIVRLIAFTQGKPVAHVLGNHIEETNTPFLDYPVGTIYQPNEHELALSRGSLLELEDALLSMHGVPRRLALSDFSVWPTGRQFAQPGDKDRYEKHVKQEKEKMWDHTTP
jgi:glyoxylase-like metal-dependent hydrolase (beta-lactamase superfamily II)